MKLEIKQIDERKFLVIEGVAIPLLTYKLQCTHENRTNLELKVELDESVMELALSTSRE